MTHQGVRDLIEREFTAARQARLEGNEGRLRVCARRAASLAIGTWRLRHPRPDWGIDAISQLHGLQQDSEVPEDVRDAARRLAARVGPDFRSAAAEDPLDDATRIITHLLPIEQQ